MVFVPPWWIRGNHVWQRRGFTACKCSNSLKRYCITKYDFEAAVLYPNLSELYCTLEFTIDSFFVVSFNLNHIFTHSMANLICNNNKWFGRKSKDVYLLSIPQEWAVFVCYLNWTYKDIKPRWVTDISICNWLPFIIQGQRYILKKQSLQLKGWEHNRPMSNFSPFFDVARICPNFCMCTAIWLKTIVQYFFTPLCVSYWCHWKILPSCKDISVTL